MRYGEAKDSRRRPVELTPRGRRHAKKFRALALRLTAEMEAGITPAQRAAMDTGLNRLIANLDGALEKRLKDKR